MTDTGAVCSTPAALSGRRLVDLTRGELGCTSAGQQRVVVVGVICVGVVGLAVVVASDRGGTGETPLNSRALGRG